MPLTQPSELKQILEQAKTIAVVGYSDKPDRPSYAVAQTLIKAGYNVYPVNPIVKSTPELTVYASLADIPAKIDVVDIFRRADSVPEVVEEAIAVGAKVVWMQLGIENEVAAQRAEEAGLQVVMNHCMEAEYNRLIRQQ